MGFARGIGLFGGYALFSLGLSEIGYKYMLADQKRRAADNRSRLDKIYPGCILQGRKRINELSLGQAHYILNDLTCHSDTFKKIEEFKEPGLFSGRFTNLRDHLSQPQKGDDEQDRLRAKLIFDRTVLSLNTAVCRPRESEALRQRIVDCLDQLDKKREESVGALIQSGGAPKCASGECE